VVLPKVISNLNSIDFAVARAVSLWLLTAPTGVQFQIGREGFVVDVEAIGQVSPNTFVSPVNSRPPTALYSLIILSLTYIYIYIFGTDSVVK
jgi:hypothetical protein